MDYGDTVLTLTAIALLMGGVLILLGLREIKRQKSTT